MDQNENAQSRGYVKDDKTEYTVDRLPGNGWESGQNFY